MSLQDLIAAGLPMNRKERFFTGTVFPMIVCADDFAFFDRFLALLPHTPSLSINADPDETNIQFFTEYGLMESIYGPARERFAVQPTSRDTPDIICLINERQKTLIALEAKMYDRPTRESVEKQMKRQRENVLDYLQGVLSIDDVLHAALLPVGLLTEFGDFAYPVVTWEALLATFTDGRRDDYWLRMLRLALDAWPSLVGPGAVFGQNAEARLRGLDIVSMFRNDDCESILMGRSQGLHGGPLDNDLASGGWRTHIYEVRRGGMPPHTNWFPISDFVAAVKKRSRRDSARSEDSWSV